jgi:hypothetical protein
MSATLANIIGGLAAGGLVAVVYYSVGTARQRYLTARLQRELASERLRKLGELARDQERAVVAVISSEVTVPDDLREQLQRAHNAYSRWSATTGKDTAR